MHLSAYDCLWISTELTVIFLLIISISPRSRLDLASQLSPQFGLTPSAMLDFLATDEALLQLEARCDDH